MKKETRKVRRLSELCLHFELWELPDKRMEEIAELEEGVYQDLTQAVRRLSHVRDELRRRERRKELEALAPEVLLKKLKDIETRREAHAPISRQDEIDERLIVEILHKKPRRGTRR